jgi:tetratricopeptide (TPR) repeat protein
MDRWTAKGYSQEGLICLEGLAAHLIKGKKDLTLAAGILTQISRVLSSSGKYADAEAQLVKAQNLSDDRRISSIALHELGSLCLYRGDLSTAFENYQKGLNICLKERSQIIDEASANLLGMVFIRLLQHRYDDVYSLAEDALEKAKACGDVYRTVGANRILALAYKDNLKFEKSEEHLWMADLLAEIGDLHLEKVAILHLRAWVEYTRLILNDDFNLDPVVELFNETIVKGKKCSYIPYIHSARLGLVCCFLVQYNTQSADALLFEVEQAITSESSYDLIIGTKLRRASVTHKQGHLDQAEIQYKNNIDLCRQYRQKPRESDAWQGLGSIYRNRGNSKEAEESWQRAESVSKQCSLARNGLIVKAIKRSRKNPKATPL